MVMHVSAIVENDAVLAEPYSVGPWAVLGVDGEGAALTVGPRAVIRSHAVLYRGSTIGSDFHAGHAALMRDSVIIGDSVSIGSHAVVEHSVQMGDHVRLHSGCFVPEYSKLDDGAWLGPGVILTNARYPNRADTKDNLEGVHICTGAVVGAGAILLPGVTIGARALVGAGAVVVRDVLPGETVIGNPSRPIRA
jgi:acetyltransferase-like isoleucine patch superfamily enzyme